MNDEQFAAKMDFLQRTMMQLDLICNALYGTKVDVTLIVSNKHNLGIDNFDYVSTIETRQEMVPLIDFLMTRLVDPPRGG